MLFVLRGVRKHAQRDHSTTAGISLSLQQNSLVWRHSPDSKTRKKLIPSWYFTPSQPPIIRTCKSSSHSLVINSLFYVTRHFVFVADAKETVQLALASGNKALCTGSLVVNVPKGSSTVCNSRSRPDCRSNVGTTAVRFFCHWTVVRLTTLAAAQRPLFLSSAKYTVKHDGLTYFTTGKASSWFYILTV